MSVNHEILKIDNISYIYKSKYRNVKALSDVNITFEQGKLYSITGSSGSGKTTLLSILAGLDKPTNGDVLFEGNSILKMNLDEYRKKVISVIYQDFHLFPRLTAIENVFYPLELQKVKVKIARDQAKELLERMNLKDHCHKHFSNMLSGGERQRVAIARALITQPKILLADEPTGNLDSENSKKIVEILKELAHKENYLVIMVTHDLELASMSDYIVRLKDGVVVSDS